MPPHCSTTSGGVGFFWPALFSVGHAAAEQLLHGPPRTDAVLGAGGVEEHLDGQLARVRAGELRRAGAPWRPWCGLRSHLADFAIVSFLGVELEADGVLRSRRACSRRVSGRGCRPSARPCPGAAVRATALPPAPASPGTADGACAACQGDRGGHWPAPGGRNPWCAISSVSMATFGESRLSSARSSAPAPRRAGPSVATTVPSRGHRRDAWRSCGSTPLAMPTNHSAILSLSRPTGRESLTLVYLIRLGSCQTKPLLPPSSRCSMHDLGAEPFAAVERAEVLAVDADGEADADGRVGGSVQRIGDALCSGHGVFLRVQGRRSVSRPDRSRSCHSSARKRADNGS